MSIHVYGVICTQYGTAANNRGENDGNITTLQKIVWKGNVHSTVSAEAIRFALRRQLGKTNRTWSDESRSNEWKDPEFKGWAKEDGERFIDDDLLGFMSATAAKEEGKKGSTTARRSTLEITRAVSLSPWAGDITFNAASPGATASAAKKGGGNPVLYGTELHATRYQYGFAFTPERLSDKKNMAVALTALGEIGPVAGNHARFLYDFSPDSIIIRITHDPAPRILYAFQDDNNSLCAPIIKEKIAQGDIKAEELFIGGTIAGNAEIKSIEKVTRKDGVKDCIKAALEKIEKETGK